MDVDLLTCSMDVDLRTALYFIFFFFTIGSGQTALPFLHGDPLVHGADVRSSFGTGHRRATNAGVSTKRFA